MEKIIKIAACSVLIAALAGCEKTDHYSYPYGDTTQHGDVVGGVVQSGGSAHYRGGPDKSTLTGGTLLKGVLNSDVGKAMDRQDQMNMQQAVINTPLDQEAQWSNKRRHAKYAVTPLREYHNVQGQTCREYEATVDKNGKKERAYGKACKTADGKWNLKN